MRIITISVSIAHIAVVESAETVMSYFVSLICGERTERVARALGFSAIDMGRTFRLRDGITLRSGTAATRGRRVLSNREHSDKELNVIREKNFPQ